MGYARGLILPNLPGICQAASQHIKAAGSAEALIPFLEMCAGLATSVGDELFQCPQIPMVREVCLAAAQSADQDILKPTLLVLQKVVMSRTIDPAAQNVPDIIKIVLLSFHKWPRSLAGQTFKLFSAMVERHEAVFLPIAMSPEVPCMGSLPGSEQAVAQHAFRTVRGPRFKMFLGDLAAVARGENTADCIQT